VKKILKWCTGRRMQNSGIKSNTMTEQVMNKVAGPIMAPLTASNMHTIMCTTGHLFQVKKKLKSRKNLEKHSSG
jgi:hypothetical protein